MRFCLTQLPSTGTITVALALLAACAVHQGQHDGGGESRSFVADSGKDLPPEEPPRAILLWLTGEPTGLSPDPGEAPHVKFVVSGTRVDVPIEAGDTNRRLMEKVAAGFRDAGWRIQLEDGPRPRLLLVYPPGVTPGDTVGAVAVDRGLGSAWTLTPRTRLDGD